MLKKRIIPCLDIKDGRTVKGVQFEELREAGDPIALAQKYVTDGADELVFLDISATNEQRKTFAALVLEIACVINIPFTVGGGISTLDDVDRLIASGADKISINTAAINNSELISQIAHKYGSQCVVVAVDVKKVNNNWKVFKNGGRIATEIDATSWAKIVEDKGAGEILLTSMNNDGTHDGFALDITANIADIVNIPIIASGGAGCMGDFQTLFNQTKANAALAASVFHFNTIPIPALKQFLRTKNISVR